MDNTFQVKCTTFESLIACMSSKIYHIQVNSCNEDDEHLNAVEVVHFIVHRIILNEPTASIVNKWLQVYIIHL